MCTVRLNGYKEGVSGTHGATATKGVTMDYTTFCKIAKQARTTRTVVDVSALVAAYGVMACAMYPHDAKMVDQVLGGVAPAGWTLRPYCTGYTVHAA